MEYRTLGRTGLRVSAVGFGGAPAGLPNYLTRDDRDSAGFQEALITAVRTAVDRGINYFDTAPGYGDGRSERLMGRALEGVRDRVHVATKYGFNSGDPPERYTARFRESLDRLHTGFVDVLQLHGTRFDEKEADAILKEGALDWARTMQAQGLARFTGITAEVPTGALERIVRSGKVDVLQITYSLIAQGACDYQREPYGIVPMARAHGLGVVANRTATSGFLQKLFAREFPEIDPGTLTQLAIRFVLSTPEIDCALVGMRTVAEVEENARLARDVSTRMDLKALHDRFS